MVCFMVRMSVREVLELRTIQGMSFTAHLITISHSPVSQNHNGKISYRLLFSFFYLSFTILYEFEPPHSRGSERSHTRTHHSRQDSSGRVISPSQRSLYLTTHTTLTTDNHPCPRRDSNPQSQQAIGRRRALDRSATGSGYRLLLEDTLMKPIHSGPIHVTEYFACHACVALLSSCNGFTSWQSKSAVMIIRNYVHQLVRCICSRNF